MADFGAMVKSLPIEAMFSAPLVAAIKCHTAACESVAEFIDKVGMAGPPDQRTVRMVRFQYKEAQLDANGNPTGNAIDRVIDMPFLAAIPLPTFGVDKVTIDFDLQVDTSESTSSSTESSASISGKVGFAWWSVSFQGSITHKSEQTRKSDTRAKYTVHLEAGRQNPPEALMRVIDAITNAAARPISKDKAPALPAPANAGGQGGGK